MFEARIFLAFNLLLLGAVWVLPGVIGPWTGMGAILTSFIVSGSIFAEVLQGRIGYRRSGLLLMIHGTIYLAVASLVNFEIGVVGTDGRIEFWSDAVYFTIVTFTTLGYGDLQPVSDLRLLAAVQALLGYLFLGLSIVMLTGWLTNEGRTRN